MVPAVMRDMHAQLHQLMRTDNLSMSCPDIIFGTLFLPSGAEHAIFTSCSEISLASGHRIFLPGIRHICPLRTGGRTEPAWPAMPDVGISLHRRSPPAIAGGHRTPAGMRAVPSCRCCDRRRMRSLPTSVPPPAPAPCGAAAPTAVRGAASARLRTCCTPKSRG